MMIDTVQNYLEADGWPIRRIGDDTAFSMTCEGEHGRWPVIVKTDEESGLVIIWSRCPVEASAEHAEAIGLLLSQINSQLTLGNFECDDGAGDVRFRTSLRHWNHELSTMDFAVLLQTNVTMVDRFLPAIRRVAERGDNVELVLAEATDLND